MTAQTKPAFRTLRYAATQDWRSTDNRGDPVQTLDARPARSTDPTEATIGLLPNPFREYPTLIGLPAVVGYGNR
jgi:hypothetical protein